MENIELDTMQKKTFTISLHELPSEIQEELAEHDNYSQVSDHDTTTDTSTGTSEGTSEGTTTIDN